MSPAPPEANFFNMESTYSGVLPEIWSSARKWRNLSPPIGNNTNAMHEDFISYVITAITMYNHKLTPTYRLVYIST